ncbi:hypothetical protein [Poseidonibacter ostreae]|jgi:hypothetical protein|uniref:LPP20 lipoprotein n=1 Tax=Poseidonibacter ostreae TaxID=2654171 RepID=A0A6L4WRS1_9BACT|nr:hypothetical protein [Poseidonibacter ostreae]KAB7883092.1 hypothetical protein GA417_13095 [Poseidonibacter ostreae]KAB7888199.1 hypothetical protein GBG19_09570 [Poseidonibacter ostreae]KAB7892025.1 hypothetical protein GBG18_04525 [Poseidonibacter ostreae]
MKNFLFLLFLIPFSLFSKDVIEESEYCKTNWTIGTIECTGESAEEPVRYNAKRASVTIARRNLLEYTEGVKIDSSTTVKDGMLKSDIITSSVIGTVNGAQVISNKYNSSDKYATAVIKIDLGKDLLKSILRNDKLTKMNSDEFKFFTNIFNTQLNAKEVYTTNEKETINKLIKDFKETDNKSAKEFLEKIIEEFDTTLYSGILIDARELKDMEIALNLKLVNTYGEEIYPSNLTKKTNFIEKNGVSVALDLDINDARNNARVLNVPYEIKAVSTFKNKKSDLVISNEDIEKLNPYNMLLKQAKIIVVVPKSRK